jgi:hypothetical protein
MIWVSWPKKSSKAATDLDENLIRDLALRSGLVDAKVCAVDEPLKPLIDSLFDAADCPDYVEWEMAQFAACWASPERKVAMDAFLQARRGSGVDETQSKG